MSLTFKVGDHVHLRGYTKGNGTGIVTEVAEEQNGDRVPFTAVYVEYDKPMPRPWPYQNKYWLRGRHAADSLELI